MVAEDDRPRPRADHEQAFASMSAERDRTLEALHDLEVAAGQAAPGREDAWIREISERLAVLEDAVRSEREEAARPDSLQSMIGRDYPRRFGSRIRQLRDQLDDILQQIRSLQSQIERLESQDVDYADLRRRLAWVARAVHHRRAREADLVYEAITLDL